VSETGYIEVKNFDQFQHYKQRNPPWIKLHASMMEDYEFARLPEVAQLHLIGIWVLASKTGNKIPADPVWIGRRINAQSPVDVELLVSSGFVRRLRRASDAQAPDKQVVTPSRGEERRDRGEAEESTKATPSGDACQQVATPGVDRAQLIGALRKICGPRQGKISEAAMRTNASCVDLLAGGKRKWSYADIHQAAAGTRTLIDRGAIPSIPAGTEWTLRVLTDATPDVDPMQRGLDAFRAQPPPAPTEKRGGMATGIADVLDFSKFAKGA
jgi:hypothetical protein